MARRRRSLVSPPVVTDVDVVRADILRAEPAAIARLAASHRETWQACAGIYRCAGEPRPCSPELVHALLAIDDMHGWLRRVFSAYQGLNPDDGQEAYFGFLEWFSAGLVQHLPPTDPAVLALAYKRALDDVAEGSAQRTTALMKTIYEAGDTKEHRALLGRALLLLARRVGEEGDLDAASATAQRAQDIFAQLGDAASRLFAIRVRAAALLFLGKKGDAAPLLDEIVGQQSPTFARDGMFRRIQGSEANVALWSTSAGYDWVHALSAVAEPNKVAEQDDDDDTFTRGPFV